MANNSAIYVDPNALIELQHQVAAWPKLQLSSAGGAGDFVSKHRGSGLDFHDIRLFQQGDDLRHIDAMATARSGRFQTKSFNQEMDRNVYLVADFRRSMLWGTDTCLRSVVAAKILALTGWRAQFAGAKIGAFIVSDQNVAKIPASANGNVMVKICTTLAQYHQEALTAETAQPAIALDHVLEEFCQNVPRNGSVFLASGLDDLGDDFAQVTAAIRQFCQLVIFRIEDRIQTQSKKSVLPCVGTDGRPVWMEFGQKYEAESDVIRVRSDADFEQLRVEMGAGDHGKI